MTREDKIMEVQELGKKINQTISIRKYMRQRIVQEEIIDAYLSPVPSAVMIGGRPKMVEKGDWIVIHIDGSQDVYKPGEFEKVFEIIKEPTPPPAPGRR